ncbi:MAG: hypothetical protein JRG91_20695 [Deltaproteobacteria bacterium]|nr:hypothetical protein [Deltaproteobacteria bacterium]
MALAIPEERVSFFESRAQERRSWVGLGVGYLFTGYPTQQHWYHGIAFDVSVFPIERLALFLDLGISFLQDEVRGETTTSLRYALTSTQFLVGIGARYDILGHDRVALLPEAGFHVGFSAIDVSYHGVGIDDTYEKLKVNPSMWAGVQLRVRIVSRVSLGVGLRFEYVFRYEQGFLVEGDEDNPTKTSIYKASRFRFGALAMVSVSI